ncbi:MAG: class I SAM-dependent methyltransferase [Alphaproteobacteria bacterium]|nr:class I SAM-dependent methyltransferase [Alphaproteobacteria bacterium]
MTQIDKAGTPYWDKNWSNADLPIPFDPTDQRFDNYFNLELHKYFQNLLKDKKGFSVLEIGCANSVWPLYFYKYFDANVSGLDYSEIGCAKSRYILDHFKVPGEIFCGDLFSPSPELIEKFDLVVSFGVVEHFEDTAHCLSSCAKYVKPGGILLTLIPNMPSIIGFIQKLVDRSVYDVHVPLTKEKLAFAHKEGGLNLISCDHFMSINLSVVNSGAFSSHRLNALLRHVLSGTSKICWALEKYGLKIPKNRVTSPYIIAVAKM